MIKMCATTADRSNSLGSVTLPSVPRPGDSIVLSHAGKVGLYKVERVDWHPLSREEQIMLRCSPQSWGHQGPPPAPAVTDTTLPDCEVCDRPAIALDAGGTWLCGPCHQDLAEQTTWSFDHDTQRWELSLQGYEATINPRQDRAWVTLGEDGDPIASRSMAGIQWSLPHVQGWCEGVIAHAHERSLQDEDASPQEPTEDSSPSQIRRHTWKAFREAGLLWWVNRSLHLFGWSLVLVSDKETKEVVDAYPARTTWRGFPPDGEAEGFEQLTMWLRANARDLEREVLLPEGDPLCPKVLDLPSDEGPPATHGWVSVADRLPDPGSFVVAWRRSPDGVNGWVTAFVLEGRWHVPFGEEEDPEPIDDVTHWTSVTGGPGA